MGIEKTTTLTNSILANVYQGMYLKGVEAGRLYDQLAVPYTDPEVGGDGKSMRELMQGTTINVPVLSVMSPGTTAISESADITPQTLRDALVNITHTSRGEALQFSEALEIRAYTDYTAKAYARVGENMIESIELLAEAAALQGSWVERYTARASIDAGSAEHRASDSIFRKYEGMMKTLRVPGLLTNDGMGTNEWMAIMHDFPFHDICESGNVDSIGLYQDAGIHLNFELGKLGSFRLVVSPFAKVFGGAGADNGTAVATTLDGATNSLATTITTADDVSGNAAIGLFWTIGTEETANTFYPTNERVKILSASGTTVTVLGQAENGGLRYDHASGVAVRNADSVYTILFGGPKSLVKVYAEEIGEYGTTVGPKTSGLLDQFNSLGWKYYGGYGLLSQNRILRYECSTSYEA